MSEPHEIVVPIALNEQSRHLIASALRNYRAKKGVALTSLDKKWAKEIGDQIDHIDQLIDLMVGKETV
jgi:hypothetical protein